MRMLERNSGAIHTSELKGALASWMTKDEKQRFHLHFKNQDVFACEDDPSGL